MAFVVSVCARPPDADLLAGTRAVVMIHGQFEGAETFGAGIVFGREKNRLYVVTASHVVRRGAATAQKIEIHLKDVPGMPLKATLVTERMLCG
jgi:hypothetical protein